MARLKRGSAFPNSFFSNVDQGLVVEKPRVELVSRDELIVGPQGGFVVLIAAGDQAKPHEQFLFSRRFRRGDGLLKRLVCAVNITQTVATFSQPDEGFHVDLVQGEGSFVFGFGLAVFFFLKQFRPPGDTLVRPLAKSGPDVGKNIPALFGQALGGFFVSSVEIHLHHRRQEFEERIDEWRVGAFVDARFFHNEYSADRFGGDVQAVCGNILDFRF